MRYQVEIHVQYLLPNYQYHNPSESILSFEKNIIPPVGYVGTRDANFGFSKKGRCPWFFLLLALIFPRALFLCALFYFFLRSPFYVCFFQRIFFWLSAFVGAFYHISGSAVFFLKGGFWWFFVDALFCPTFFIFENALFLFLKKTG